MLPWYHTFRVTSCELGHDVLLVFVQGLSPMLASLEELGNQLTRGVVPTLWSSASYPSVKPLGSWVTDLAARVAFFSKWIQDGPPEIMWLPGSD